MAQGLAAERPDLVRAVVLLDTAAKLGTEAGWRERIGKVRAGGIDAIADGVLKLWFTRAFRAERADELAVWRHMLARTPVEGYCGCCAALAGIDLRESTARLRLPVLVVGRRRGRLDAARPRARDRGEHRRARASRSSAAPATSPASSSRRRSAPLITDF